MKGLQGLVKGGHALNAGLFGASVGVPLAAGLHRRKGSKERVMRQAYAEEQAWQQKQAATLRQRRLQRDMAENASRLAAVAPDVYNRVLAGRMLPKGAVVLGGEPRTDLLEELTTGMAQGAYQTPPVDDSDVLAALAG